MPYTDQNAPHAGSAEVLTTGLFDELAGTVARTIPRGLVSSATLAALATSGQAAVRAIPLAAGMPVNNIAVLTGNTAANGPTHFWLGLLDQNLNTLAASADQLTAAIAANTMFKLAMATPYQVQFTGLYYVACSVSTSTTQPTLAGAGAASGIAAGPPALCGTAGSQAGPPAIGAQLNSGAITSNGTMNFAAWIS